MKIKIHNSTYIVLLLSFLSGYFEYMYLFLLIIIIHEIGHVIFGYFVNFKYSTIIIYPFGGLTIYNEELNINSNKELISLLAGIIFQILFYLLILLLYNNLFITNHVFMIIKKINILLISFNFLPILPLDGGRLLCIILEKIFPYKKSNIIALIISVIFIIIFVLNSKTYLSIILSIFLIKTIIIETNNLKYKYNLFLLERYLHDYNFKHIKYISSINNIKRDYYHYINYINEKKVLSSYFSK